MLYSVNGSKSHTAHTKKRLTKVNLCTSGYRDSNPGPPTPEAGALTGLRYIPNNLVYC